MANLIASDKQYLIVGAGVTGLSAARYLEKKGVVYRVFDTREDQKHAAPFKQINRDVSVILGSYAPSILDGVERIVLSPGVSRNEPVIVDALEKGIEVVSDISVFLEEVTAPVVGITGTNGKSTVTTMVGLVAKEAGIKTSVGGNLGTPALDLIDETAELYVLELSSFQLESTRNANLTVAANINVSQDHLDRHGSFDKYFMAKQKVFHGAKSVVYNLGDQLTQPPIVSGVKRFGFGLSKPTEVNEIRCTIDVKSGDLLFGSKKTMPQSKVKLKGKHNLENVLAVMAICGALNIDDKYLANVATDFGGLPHRCEIAASESGITYINDSKATNVGAAVSAVEGFSQDFNKKVLIAGGVGKGQDFHALGKALAKNKVDLVLFGEDAKLIRSVIPSDVKTQVASCLDEAVSIARKMIEDESAKNTSKEDLILFSPACASFDMFKNFEARGRAFKRLVSADVEGDDVEGVSVA